MWLMAFRFSLLCHRLRRVHGHGYHGMGLHTQTRIIDRQRQQNHYYNHSIERCAAPRRLRQFECRTPDPKLITLSQDPVHQRNELILRFLRVFSSSLSLALSFLLLTLTPPTSFDVACHAAVSLNTKYLPHIHIMMIKRWHKPSQNHHQRTTE